MWKCPKCKREFAKENQSHSCVSYPIENHFKNKDTAKRLFDALVKKITKEIGPVKIESLPCCIHLVSDYTFGAVWALKDRIRIDLRVDYPLKNIAFYKEVQMSANRYLYFFEFKDEADITPQIMKLLKESYFLNK
ncbi:hypothetical protein JW962_02570 [Candidatus Dojkabacteria bacterium]|nr:hypothetical protein [Candidatus Dojkabacteria bacterium]